MRYNWVKGTFLFISMLMLWTMDSKAEITGDDAFSNIIWEQVFEENLIQPVGVVQSICATEDYIITIENTAENEDADVVSSYYKNNIDKDGNAVEQYSLAKRVMDTNWEHGNGMTYNPNTGEIYVALYSEVNPENRGSLFVMDPETLGYKYKIKISDEFNVLGIDYKKDTNQYIIQTNIEGGYSFKILDTDFNLVEDLGQYVDTAKGNNFQDLVVSGDYIMNFPLTLNLGIGDYLHVYSISRKMMVVDQKLDFQFQEIVEDEPEALCEIEPGVFLAAVNVVNTAGARKIRFYKTELPYYFHVTVRGEDGRVSQGAKVLRGESHPITYEPQKGYELTSLRVNGKREDITKHKSGYILENIQKDYTVEPDFSKISTVKKDGTKRGGEVVSILVVLAGCALVLFLAYVIHIKRTRRRKLLCARELRRKIATELR